MTPAQEFAINNIVDNNESLQALWNTPRRFALPKSQLGREVLIVTIVAVENNQYYWSAGVRLYSPKKSKVIPLTSWSIFERVTVSEILTSELLGVGDMNELTDETFETKFALHLKRVVAPQERDLILRPELLGNKTNGKPLNIITSKNDAMGLLDKYEKDLKDLKDQKEQRIIKPGSNN